MIRTALRAAALALLLLSSAWAQEAALMRRATELRAAPGDAGRSLAALPAQAPVTRTGERQGPWVQVRTAEGAMGWVHLFDLGPAATGASASGGSDIVGGALRGVTSLFGGRPTTQAATTSGIRGLGAEDLAQAQPDAAAVTQMERLRQSEADARSFAARAAWTPAAVAPLPAPAPATSPAAGSGNPEQLP
jgi:hypothetical protein